MTKSDGLRLHNESDKKLRLTLANEDRSQFHDLPPGDHVVAYLKGLDLKSKKSTLIIEVVDE